MQAVVMKAVVMQAGAMQAVMDHGSNDDTAVIIKGTSVKGPQ
tara:strand:- start:45 stop:170 length:126 start_codon:yes stop_codon:yes gene_type:complete